MKFIWEPHDIEPGRRVFAHNQSEEYIITWSHADAPARYGMVSLIDGMTAHQDKTREEMAAFMNDAGNLPAAGIWIAIPEERR